MKRTLSILTMAMLLVAACSQQEDKNTTTSSTPEKASIIGNQKVDPVLPALKKAPKVFTFNAAEAQTLTTETGSRISIPKNAFVDADGNPIKGDVQIEFEEFHSATDVVLSGIPMNYETEDGKMEFFETAGMFNIKGSQGGKDIHIAADKAIDIELASYQPEKDYNFYELDQEKGEWEEKVPAKDIEVRKNEVREALAKVIPPTPKKPIEIKKATSKDLVIEFAIDKQKNPEFAAFDNVLWRSKDPDPRAGNLFKSRLDKASLTATDNSNTSFRLTGVTPTGGKVETVVEPVLFGSKFKEAQARFQAKLKKYNKAVEEKKVKQANLNKMAKLQRNLSVNNFGIYNCDRYSRLIGKKKIQFSALFFIPALQKRIKQGFLIIKEKGKKIAIPMNSGTSQFFTYAPSEHNTVISFDDEGYLYEFPADRFSEVTAKGLKKGDEYTLNLEKTPYKVTSAQELTDYIDQI